MLRIVVSSQCGVFVLQCRVNDTIELVCCRRRCCVLLLLSAQHIPQTERIDGIFIITVLTTTTTPVKQTHLELSIRSQAQPIAARTKVLRHARDETNFSSNVVMGMMLLVRVPFSGIVGIVGRGHGHEMYVVVFLQIL